MRAALLALLLLLWIAAASPAADAAVPPPVALKLQQVVIVDNAPAVLLVDEEEQRYLLIFIDYFMANAIHMGMAAPDLERPLTHDLIGILLRRLGAQVVRITITELRDNTYYALITVRVNAAGELAEFDARPSDALAIAVRNRAPIYVAPALLKPVAGSPLERTVPDAPPAQENAARGRT